MISRLSALVITFCMLVMTIVTVFQWNQLNAREEKIELNEQYNIFYRAETPIKFNHNDLICLARNIFFEAATESVIGKYAVAQVTVNRVEHSKFPTTICKVVYDPYQFSWTLDKKNLKRQPKGPNWDESFHVAVQVLYGNIRLSLVDEALFYHATYVNPRWAKHKTFIARIETHIFYKYRDT